MGWARSTARRWTSRGSTPTSAAPARVGRSSATRPARELMLKFTIPALLAVALLTGCGGSSGPAVAGGCDPNYEGACLDVNASDYDCEGGSGNGPKYTGSVRVVGDDPFGL